uniref:Peroxisome assembly protein 12 n=1 Tax=Saccoglossus kowalevskii TaxID=10224 RepID=A0ABM0MSK7_SACKO|nr:PREDICTED: peroxisome assembly protein 12-like [Saccoglossus kowalevskii]
MAEFGAHLTSATADEDKPTIFEVIAERNPSRYSWLYQYSDEVYTIIDLLLQQHFLSTTCASFSENFYGLKRVPIIPGKQKVGLPRSEHLNSIMLLVIVPYLKIKCDALFERWKHEWLDGIGVSQSQRDSLKKFSVKLQHLTKEDILQQMQPLGSPFTEHNSFSTKLKTFSKWTLGVIAVGVSSGLSVAVFFLQFLEWWYTNESHRNSMALTALPVPSPPHNKTQLDSLPPDTLVCPLCHRRRTNDTTLSTSGYVFCYPCIYTYVQSHKCCPITRYPSKTNHLIKLYLPTS